MHLEYPLITLLPDPLCRGVVLPVMVPCMGQIDLFENCSYSIGVKKTFKKQLYKKYKH